MFDEIKPFLKKTSNGFESLNKTHICVLDKMLSVNLNETAITEELAYIYFNNIELNVPFNSLSYSKNLYKDKILSALKKRFNDILFNVTNNIFNDFESVENNKKTKRLFIPKEFYNTLKSIIKVGKKFFYNSNMSYDLNKGLIDGFYQTIKTKANNSVMTIDYKSYNEDYDFTEKFYELSSSDIYGLKDIFITENRNIKLNNSPLFQNSFQIKILLILIYSSFLKEYYELRNYKQYVNSNEYKTLDEFILLESKTYRYGYLFHDINQFKDLSLESAIMVNPNRYYSHLYHPELWGSKTNYPDDKGREFLFMLLINSIAIYKDNFPQEEYPWDSNKTPETVALEN